MIKIFYLILIWILNKYLFEFLKIGLEVAVLVLADTILIIVKSYIQKLFGWEQENNKAYTKVYFERLRNNPSARLYYLLLFVKRMFYTFLFFTFIFLISFRSVSENYYNEVASWFFTFIICAEWLWMYYLIKIWPFKTFSENRISILNQFFILAICIWNMIVTALRNYNFF